MRIFLSLLSLLCVFFAAGMAVGQSDDRGFLQGLLEDGLSDAGRVVRIEGFSGALSSRATIETLTIADDQGVWITLRGVALQWNRGQLVRGRIEIAELAAEEVLLPRAPGSLGPSGAPSPEAKPFTLPQLPVSVELGALRIGRLVVGAPLLGQEAEFAVTGSASLIDGAARADLAVTRTGDAPEGEIQFQGAFANTDRVLSLSLQAQEAAGGLAVRLLGLPEAPAAELRIAGTGPISDYSADVALSTDGAPRLTGQVRLSSEVGSDGVDRSVLADLSGDLRPLVEARYRAFLGPEQRLLALGRQAADGRLILEDLTVSSAALQIVAQMETDTTGWPVRIAASGFVTPPADAEEILLSLPGAETRLAGARFLLDHDASVSDGWTLNLSLDGLRQSDLAVDLAELSGSGRLSRDLRRAEGTLALALEGIALDDPHLAQAIGSRLAGGLDVLWTEGGALRLTGMTLGGADYGFRGDAAVQGVAGSVDLEITGAGRLSAQDLSRFAGLAGLDLSGAAELALQGSILPISGAFDLDITGDTQGLGLGIAQLDPLIAGQTTLTLLAARDTEGLRVETFRIAGASATVQAQADIATDASDVTFGVDLADLGQVVAGADGPAQLEGTARGRGAEWRLETRLTAPGATRLDFEGTVTLAEGAVGPVAGILDGTVGRLEAYAALLPQPIAGRVDLSGRVEGDVAQADYVISLEGFGQDLVTGATALDPLLKGRSTLTLRGTAQSAALALETFEVRTDAVLARASGTLSAAQSDLDVALDLESLGLVVPQLTGPARVTAKLGHLGPVVTVDARARGTGDTDLTLTGAVTLVDGQPGPVLGTAQGSVGQLRAFAALAGRDLSGAAEIALEGRGDLRALSFAGDIRATLDDLVTGLPELDQLVRGRTQLDATALAYAAGQADIGALRLVSDALDLSAQGTVSVQESRVRFDARLADVALFADGLSGPVSVTGTAGHSGDVLRVDASGQGPGNSTAQIDGSVTLVEGRPGPVLGVAMAEIPRLDVFAPLAQRPLRGGLRLEIGGQGDLQSQSATASVELRGRDLSLGIDAVDALLAGESTLSAGGVLGGGQLLLERLLLDAPAARLLASGSLSPTTADIDFDASLKQPGLLVPGMPGPVSLLGTASRVESSAAVLATLEGAGATTGKLDLTVNLREAAPPTIAGRFEIAVEQLSAYRALAGQPLAGALSASGSGRMDLGDLSLDVSLAARGGGLRVGIPAVDTLLAGASSARAALARGGDGALTLRLESLQTPLVSASGTGRLDGARQELTAEATLRDVAAFVPRLTGGAQARLEASSSGGPYQTSLSVTGPGGSSASATGQVARTFSTASLAITGAAPLGLLNRFTAPNLVEGQARFDLGLNGPFALPSVSGTVGTTGARVTFPLAKIGLAGIDASVALAGGSATLEAAGEVTTGGRVSVSGQLGTSAPFNSQIRAVLSGIRAAEPGLYETSVNGEIGLNGPLLSRATMTGVLNIGQTEIRIPEVASSANGEISGLVHLNEPAAVRQTRDFAGLLAAPASGGSINYPVDLAIRAPSRVFIRGRGLDAELGGSLRLRGTIQDVITEGRFELVRGRLDFLGQRLDLTEASATLQGNLDPFVRAVAVTARDGTDIQITVEGVASDPEVTFTSVPELPQDEVLALLLFGRNIAQISPLQALRLANAIRLLAGQGGEGLVGRLRRDFGLDDLDIDTDENNQAQIRLGKHLTENVYTDVTVGTTGRSEINLNLTLTPSLTVRGSVASDGNTGLGIFFEKDY